MKARLKSTGHIIDVYYDRDDPSILVGKSGLHYSKDVLDIIYTPDYWEKLKHQYAGQLMTAIFTSPQFDRCSEEAIIRDSISLATELVNKLKEGE